MRGKRLSQASDEALITEAKEGNLAAFSELVDRYKKPIFHLALRMLRNREEAEDSAQETFLRAFRSIDTFEEGRRFSPWLYQIASNLCRDVLRKRSIRGFTQSLDAPIDDDGELYPQYARDEKGPDELAVEGELREAVLDAVDRLPDKYRVVIVLRHLQDLSYQEIADVLDIPIGTVKTRLFRAREALRADLDDVVDAY